MRSIKKLEKLVHLFWLAFFPYLEKKSETELTAGVLKKEKRKIKNTQTVQKKKAFFLTFCVFPWLGCGVVTEDIA